MLGQLLESRAQRQRRSGGMAVSAVMHAAIIAAAIGGTHQVSAGAARPEEVRITYVETRAPEPRPVVPLHTPEPASPVVTGDHRILVAPVMVPTRLPDIDFSIPVTNPEEYSGRGSRPVIGEGVVGPASPVAEGRHYYANEVERVAGVLSAPPPRYPEMLRAAGVEGRVVARFVVDTSGRADVRTLQVVESSHELFAAAVRTALPGYRFAPATIGSRKVAQLVQMPFEFSLRRGGVQ